MTDIHQKAENSTGDYGRVSPFQRERLQRHDFSNGTALDYSTGEVFRPLKHCESYTQEGLLVCVSLTLGRQLFAAITAKAVAKSGSLKRAKSFVTDSLFEVRIRAQCRACGRRSLFLEDSWDSSAAQSLFRNIHRLEEGTSISWQTELRRIGPSSERAFGVWRGSGTSSLTRQLQRLLSGSDGLDG